MKKATLNKIRRIAAIALVICMAFSSAAFANNDKTEHQTKIHGWGCDGTYYIDGVKYQSQGEHLNTVGDKELDYETGKAYTVTDEDGNELGTVSFTRHGNGNKNDNGSGTDNYWTEFTKKVSEEEKLAAEAAKKAAEEAAKKAAEEEAAKKAAEEEAKKAAEEKVENVEPQEEIKIETLEENKEYIIKWIIA